MHSASLIDEKTKNAAPWILNYRGDIDGLRAIAVVSVFIFHLNPEWLTGGFVGVDIFFVISGYLITNILIRDIQEGGIRFSHFYLRRISRLFPTMLTVIAAIFISAWLIYTPQDFASTGINSASAVLSIANLKFYFQGNYFDMSPDAQPLLHFWSLSVEEQYYIFYPFLLAWLARFRLPKIGLALVVMSIISFVACIIFTFINPKAAFYLTPFRAWELGLGGAAAFAAQGVWNLPIERFRAPFAIAGFAAIFTSLFTFTENTLFPGYAAALPVFGTALLMLAGQNGNYPGRGLLSSRPMKIIGALSYTLYLWHWPVFSFIDYSLFASPETIRVVLKLAFSIGLTMATYTLIENPARKTLNKISRKSMVFFGFTVSLALVVSLGIYVRQANYVNASVKQVANGGLVFSGTKNAPKIVLLGDSNGSMYSKMLVELSQDMNYTLHVATVAAGDALPNPSGVDSQLWSESVAIVEQLEPDIVILANAWAKKLKNDRSKLEMAIEHISPHTERIIILNQPPTLPESANRSSIRSGTRPPFYENNDTAKERLSINLYLSEFSSEKIEIVDVSSIFLNSEGSINFTDAKGRLLFHDSSHLSGFGAIKIREILRNILE